MGDGTFGRVFEVRQIYNNKIYALKMIRAVERFVEAAIVYIILNLLKNFKLFKDWSLNSWKFSKNT